ncbi:MAG: hypothetical protein JWN34_2344 [Bryobacterales bacterium]|nr:hypothetical protein [Bryobacterales bacterium]
MPDPRAFPWCTPRGPPSLRLSIRCWERWVDYGANGGTEQLRFLFRVATLFDLNARNAELTGLLAKHGPSTANFTKVAGRAAEIQAERLKYIGFLNEEIGPSLQCI